MPNVNSKTLINTIDKNVNNSSTLEKTNNSLIADKITNNNKIKSANSTKNVLGKEISNTIEVDKKDQSTSINNVRDILVENVSKTNNITDKNINNETIKIINPSFFERVKNKWITTSIKLKIYIFVVVIPTLIFLLYNIFIASPMYISEAKFAIRSISPLSGGVDFASQIFNVSTTSTQDAKIVEDYLKSPDIIFAVNKEINLLEHYTNSKYDFFSRLSQDPTLDEIISYWKSITLVKVNKDSNVITFSIRSFDPEKSTQIVQTALLQCEKLINSMNERARQDSLLLAKKEVDSAKTKFELAQNELKEFRNRHQDLDLKTTASGLQGLIIELEGQATSLRTQLSENLSYMKEDAPAIKALKSKLQGVEQQLEIEKKKVTSLSQQGESINTLAGLYEALIIDQEFARKQLEYAMTSYEKAKIDVLSQNLYVVYIAKPSFPDRSLYPQPFIFSLYLFIALNIILAIISVVSAAIREHMGI